MNRTLLAASLLALPVMAQAQPVTGLYVGAGAGADFMVNELFKFHRTGSASSYNAKGRTAFDTGVMGQASVGYGFGNGFRIEAEGLYSSNSVQYQSPTLRQNKYGGLVNVLFDFDIGSSFVFPYAGVGGGYVSANHRFELQAPLSGGGAGIGGNFFFPGIGTGTQIFRYRQGSAAYQGIVGASLPIPFVVGLSATIDYRFLGLADTKRTFAVSPALGGGRFQEKVLNNLNNIVTVGLRYQFNVTPPPPPPVVPAAPLAATPSRTYLVFFDWDRADLTARARQVIGDAASNAGRVQYTRIEVDGNADRSGTPAYNLGLSRRRAETVAAELVRDGIPREAIGIQAFGDTKPLIPTAAGAREPQNRRVEIVIR